MVGRVGDDQVAVAAEPVGEEVVEHAALLVAEAGVLGATDLDLRHVVGEHPLQEGERAGALDLDLAHVRDVEHARVRAHRGVLLADTLVGDRHLPTGKGNELGAELGVPLVERCASQGLRRPRAAAYWRACAKLGDGDGHPHTSEIRRASAERRRRRRPAPARLQQRVRGLHPGSAGADRAPRRIASRRRDRRPPRRRSTPGLRPHAPPPLPLGQSRRHLPRRALRGPDQTRRRHRRRTAGHLNQAGPRSWAPTTSS